MEKKRKNKIASPYTLERPGTIEIPDHYLSVPRITP